MEKKFTSANPHTGGGGINLSAERFCTRLYSACILIFTCCLFTFKAFPQSPPLCETCNIIADLSHGTLIHIVWDEYTLTSTNKYIIERSFDTINFSPMDSIFADSTVDLMTLDSTQLANINKYKILYTTESGYGTFIYNDSISDALLQSQVKYRVKIISTGGDFLYTRNADLSAHFLIYPLPSLSLPGCPPVQTPLPGFVPTGISSTYYESESCCIVTQSQFQNTIPPCNTSNVLCACGTIQGGFFFDCNCNCSCTYDKCCQHTCAFKWQCGCSCGWQPCAGSCFPSEMWIVTNVVPVSITVNVIASRSIVCSSPPYNCSNITAVVTAGGVPPYTFSWSPNIGSGPGPHNVCPGNTTTYFVTVTDPYGCTGTGAVTVTVDNPSVSVSASPNPVCSGSCTDITASGSNGTTPYIYAWNPFIGIGAGPHNVCPSNNTAYSVILTDANGCTATDQVTVTIDPLPVFTITGPTTTCNNLAAPPADVYCVSPTLPAGTTVTWSVPLGIMWSPGPGSSCITVTNWGPYATGTGVVTICATETNSGGCSTQQCIDVGICCGPYPISFPPNTYNFANTSSSAEGTNFYGATIYINGTFTIDASTTFTNCNVLMGPLAMIRILNGQTLCLASDCNPATGIMTHIHAGCGYMWKSIIIESGGKLLTSCGGNTGAPVLIEDGQQAVVSEGGGEYDLDNVWFNKNYKNIVVQSFTGGTHPGTIQNCVFTCRNLPATCALFRILLTIPPSPPYSAVLLPYPPYAGMRTRSGVEINTTEDITIGDASATSYLNFFDNMDFGVYATTSNVKVYNNRFQNITTCSTCPQNIGTAVYASGIQASLSFPMGLTVGGSGINGNTFLANGVGVKAVNWLQDIVIDDNFMSGMIIGGAWVWNCPNSNITVRNNIVWYFAPSQFFGIWCLNISGSTTRIENNSIEKPNNSATFTRGIYVSNATSSGVDLIISGNTINNQNRGIELINISGTTDPDVYGNTIVFNAVASSQNRYGISLLNCGSMHVRENYIERFIPSIDPITVRGISVVNSSRCNIGSENTITNMGSGIYSWANNTNSQYACNEFNTCFNGVYFGVGNTSGVFGKQLGFSVPTGNRWTGVAPTLTRMGGGPFITSLDWHWTGASMGSTDPGGPSGIIGLTLVGPAGAEDCSSYAPLSPDGAMRQQYFERIVTNQVDYAVDSAAYKYWDNQYAFRFFYRNPGMLDLGLPDDSVYRNFYDNMENMPMGKFEKTLDYISQDSIEDAKTENSAITPGNGMEAFRKTVNAIYLNTWAEGEPSFSAADSLTLLEIAMLDPLLNGDAVYSARVMLGIDPPEGVTGMKIMGAVYEPPMQVQEQANVFSKIYPNPNDGTMQLDYLLEKGKTGELLIYDVFGKKAGSYALGSSSEGNTLKISDDALNNGIYFYEIKVNGEMKDSDKIIIIK